jgi:AAA15 family ATPase/GTPase
MLSANDELPELLIEDFRTFLRAADIGIVDVRVEKSASDDKRRRVPRFFLRHQSKSGAAWLPLEEESRGTQTLFHIALPILQAMRKGGILLVDELERSLHPALAQQIIRQFNDPVANPKNAQLIFTTHDTNLLGNTLGEPALRRDQVWLTEKDPEGATVLYPLTDYKPRKAENLERGYLQGRYGAIPFLGDFLVAGE